MLPFLLLYFVHIIHIYIKEHKHVFLSSSSSTAYQLQQLFNFKETSNRKCTIVFFLSTIFTRKNINPSSYLYSCYNNASTSQYSLFYSWFWLLHLWELWELFKYKKKYYKVVSKALSILPVSACTMKTDKAYYCSYSRYHLPRNIICLKGYWH